MPRASSALVLLFCLGCGDTEPAHQNTPNNTPPSVPLEPEAGFLELPVLPVGAQSTPRLFYSFQPADHPDDAPVLLFVNGGPGAATSSILLPFGTGRYTIDPTPADDPPYENPHAYTSFANLLYIDTRQAGFSYDIDLNRSPCRHEGGPLSTADAAELTFALLDFLDAHETLRDNRVVIVGESYGGARAALMLYLLQHYASTEPAVPELGDFDRVAPGLRERIDAHFELAFGRSALTPEEVATQFGWQVLIQPSLSAERQTALGGFFSAHDPDFSNRPSDADTYDVRLTYSESLAVSNRVTRTLRNPAMLELLLGVELDRISGLSSFERAGAFRVLNSSGPNYSPDELDFLEAELRARLGDLAVIDAYFLPYMTPCGSFESNEATLAAFKDVAVRSHTFITNARWDFVVYTKAFPWVLEAELDMSLPAGAARPGVLWLDDTLIRFPTYEAGHAVTMTAAAELGEDLRAWLASEGAIREPSR